MKGKPKSQEAVRLHGRRGAEKVKVVTDDAASVATESFRNLTSSLNTQLMQKKKKPKEKHSGCETGCCG